MIAHPVQFHVEPAATGRVHVVVRVLLFALLAAVGCSSVYWMLYLALPAIAALLVARDGGEEYLARSAPPIVRALQWAAAAYAYLWMLTDRVPPTDGAGVDVLKVATGGQPTPVAAVSRVLTSVPALLLLLVLSFVAGVLWFAAALSILLARRVPEWIASFIAMTLAYQFRLFAYHLSLVDAYPTIADLPTRQGSGAEVF
jgi:hypothetical protein